MITCSDHFVLCLSDDSEGLYNFVGLTFQDKKGRKYIGDIFKCTHPGDIKVCILQIAVLLFLFTYTVYFGNSE